MRVRIQIGHRASTCQNSPSKNSSTTTARSARSHQQQLDPELAATDAALWTAGETYECVQRTALRSLANGAGEHIDVLRELPAAED